jgi:hypothetical protein
MLFNGVLWTLFVGLSARFKVCKLAGLYVTLTSRGMVLIVGADCCGWCAEDNIH